MDFSNNQVMSFPLLTIGMVTYNQEELVSKAIESVLNQSYTNFELLINDDCSTDNTWNVIQQYDDPRIHAIRNETNVYQYLNRNKVIDRAKGKYLIFIDGDDLMYSFGVEYGIKILELNTDAAAVYTHFFRNNIIFPVKLTPREFVICQYFGNDFLGTALTAAVFKTEIVRKEGGFSNDYISSDIFLRLKISSKYPTIITDFFFAWWRETPNQQSQRLDNAKMTFEQTEQMHVILNDSNCPITSDEKKLAISNTNRILARRLLKLLLSMRFKEFYKLKMNLSFVVFKNLFSREIKFDELIFQDYSCLNPKTIKSNENPYANN
jgi:glycosyltransferase involved in cell wall biosynthesis